MVTIASLRSGKSSFYPDQAIYAEFSAAHFGLDFAEHDGGSGLVFSVRSKHRSFHFGAGRCPQYPQNDSTSAFMATDKYFANIVLGTHALPNTGGNYFFLHDRFRKLRSPGHERHDARRHFENLGCRAFLKPLVGSRGDFAQMVLSVAEFDGYVEAVSKHYDSIIVQPIYRGREYRLFVLDGRVLYCARKSRPAVIGDGQSSIRVLIAHYSRDLDSSGVSLATDLISLPNEPNLDRIPDGGERIELPGRQNRSAGGVMIPEQPRRYDAASRLAISAASALNLGVAGVDIFEDDSEAEGAELRIIEVNSSPAIRYLEDSGQHDLILEIWRSTFIAAGLLPARSA